MISSVYLPWWNWCTTRNERIRVLEKLMYDLQQSTSDEFRVQATEFMQSVLYLLGDDEPSDTLHLVREPRGVTIRVTDN